MTLSKAFLKRIENGAVLASLLQEMHQTYAMRTGKQFDLPEHFYQLRNAQDPWDPQTWELIFTALSDFGLPLAKQKRDLIVKLKDMETVLEIVDVLFDVDNDPKGRVS